MQSICSGMQKADDAVCFDYTHMRSRAEERSSGRLRGCRRTASMNGAICQPCSSSFDVPYAAGAQRHDCKRRHRRTAHWQRYIPRKAAHRCSNVAIWTSSVAEAHGLCAML